MKKLFAALLAASMILTATGCSGDKEDNDIETVEENDDRDDDRDRDEEDQDSDENDNDRDEDDKDREDDKLPTAEASKPDSSDSEISSDSGVSYDNSTSHSGQIGDRLSNEFFAMTVNSAHRLSSVSNYVPDDPAYEYLCVNVKVQNNTTETINVGTYDFTVRWGSGEDDWDYAIEQEDFGFDKYPEGTDLGRLKSVEGNVFFFVPVDADTLYFEYIVTYDDDTVGDTYYVELKDLEYMEDPTAGDIDISENPVSYAAIGEVQHTDYLDMTVNSAYTFDEVAGYYADPGYAIVGVDVTLTNTSPDKISTGAYYFCVYWDDGGDGEYTYAVDNEEIVDLPINVDLAANESISGMIYFVVPTNNTFVFEYSDYYSETSWKDYRVELGTISSDDTATV